MRKVYLLLFSLFLFQTLKAQHPLEHTKKVYHAEDGKIYVQKSLPVYLYFSTEPNKKGEMYQLPSDSTPRFTNPMYLDTEGYNSIRSPSAVDTVTKETHFPLTDVMFELYADSKAPQTKMNYDVSKKYFDGKILYIGKNLKIDFKSWDEHSGIEQILVSIDSTGYEKYEDSIVLDKEKVYTIDYYACDKVGNAEDAKNKAFSVDLTEPKTELIFEGEKFENTISGKTKLVLKVSDNVSGVAVTHYSLDGKNIIMK
jgi:hypothetical protein